MVADHPHIHRDAGSRHGLHNDLIVYALKQDAQHLAGHLSVRRIHNVDVLRTDHHIHRLIFFKTKIHTVKRNVVKPHFIVFYHDSRQDIALTDEICHKPVDRFIINIFRRSHLLNLSVIHDHDLIRHGQRLFLVMSDKDKGNTHLLLDPLQFILHFLAQLQIQRRQRLVQQQHLRLVHQRSCNGDALLLSAGQQSRILILISFQADQFQHLHDLLVDDILGHLLDLQAKRDILIHTEMREQRIFLKYSIQFSLIRRFIADLLAIKDHFPLIRIQETSQDTQKSSLPAPAGAEKRHKFILINIQIDPFQDNLAVKVLYNVPELHQFLRHAVLLSQHFLLCQISLIPLSHFYFIVSYPS